MSMDISKLPSNSNAVKNKPQTTVTSQPASGDKKPKVVTGAVTTKKKSEVRKIADTFIAEDAGSVWNHLLHEMVIPMAKDFMISFGQTFIERMIGGNSRGGRTNTYSNPQYTQYSSISTNNNIRYAQPSTMTTRFDYEDISFTYMSDANAVLDQLDSFTRRYGMARVSDLYDLCGLTAPPTAHNYGWMNLNRARVIQVRGGFALELPKASMLD